MQKISAIDVFCGVGGLTHGMQKAGIGVRAGYDIDPACAYPYEYNNDSQFILKDISDVSSQHLSSWFQQGDIRLLAGCAPCQPFSSYSKGRDARKDRKWPLLYEFSRLIDESRTELVTMENVPDIVNHQVYNDFVKKLKKLGYYVWAKSVFCPDYGIPQMRTRHVVLASMLGPIELIKPTRKPNNYKTVKQTIGKLPSICAGEQHSGDLLHKSAGLSNINLKRIRLSKPGGSWRDWPVSLRAACHKKESGRSYSGVYARMSWDEPGPTMTTQCYGFGNGRFGHPDQDRAISLREAALLQTFPKSYRFTPPGKDIELLPVGRMIGNAVPVQLGKVIGQSLMRHVANTST